MKNISIIPIDFSEYIKYDKNIEEITLPKDNDPTEEENCIRILNGKYPVEILETNSTAKDLVCSWTHYKNKLPLDDLLTNLIQLDFLEYRKQVIPIYPYCIESLMLIDSLEKCKVIDNFASRFNKNEKLLNGLLGSKNNNKLNKLIEIYEKIVSMKNELYLAYLINRITPISFTNDDKIADFKIITMDILIDAAINIKVDTDVYLPTKQIKIDFDTVLMLIIKHGYRQIERKFNEQKANLVFVNLSMTLIGSLMSIRTGKTNDFHTIYTTALESVKKGKKGVVFYSLFRGNIDEGYFFYRGKEEVIETGKIIDKIEINLVKKSGMKLNTWDLLEIFQNLKDLIKNNYQEEDS